MRCWYVPRHRVFTLVILFVVFIASFTSAQQSEMAAVVDTSDLWEQPEPDTEVVARANAIKDEGNVFLQNHRYIQAAEKYTEALELHQSAIYYSNRAQALIKLENYGSAIMDANEALK